MNDLVAQQQQALASYGSRDDVKEIADRLMSMHPAAKQVGINTMRTVAQMAIMTGANPLPTAQEIHVWVDWKKNVNVALGIAYYRRKAAEKDTVMWSLGDSPRLMTESEKKEHQVPDDAIGAICRGFTLSKFLLLREAEINLGDAQQMLQREGVAVVTNGNMHKKDGTAIQPPNGRTWAWVARKRCEKDFYSAMSLVDMMGSHEQVIGQIEPTHPDTPDMSLDEFNDMAFDTPVVIDAEIIKPIESVNEDDESSPRIAEDVKEALITEAGNWPDAPSDKQRKAVRASLAKIGKPKEVKSIMSFVFGVSSSNDFTKGHCIAFMNWVGATADNGWQATDVAKQEAQRLLTADLKAKGQAQLI